MRLSFAGKWLELEIVMFTKISQAQKRQILHVFSPMQNLDLKNKMGFGRVPAWQAQGSEFKLQYCQNNNNNNSNMGKK
jgi:hypothetical protein